jgi:endonuclease/exonuclease/phosphatase family metal-dependent hydrolase
MLRRLHVFLAVALAAAVPTTLPAATDITVATFNCEWLIKSKIEKKYDAAAFTDAERTAKFAAAVDKVADVIKRIDADVIALCEVGPEADVEALRLAVKAKGLDYPHKAVCKSAATQFVAVLSKFPLTNVLRAIPGRECYDRELDDPEEETDTGVSKGLRVTVKLAGQPVQLYVCHFISEREGYESDAQRVAQASIVRRHYLDDLRAGKHVLVTGDLNAPRGSPALRRLRGRDDLFGDLIQTGHARYFANDDLRWTYVFKGKRNQIDHVLPSFSLKAATTSISARTIAATETLPGGKKASDHRPLIVRFRFRD